MAALGWFDNKKKQEKAAAPAPAPRPSASPAKGVSIGRLIGEQSVVMIPPGQDKEQAVSLLVRRLCELQGLGEPGPFLAKILEREQGISTTLDTGLAVPHARMDGIASIAAVLGLLSHGLPDPKQPDLTIRAMFLFFSPNRQDAFTQHLHLLRGVSALFQASFIDELLKQGSPAAVAALIRSKESSS